MSDGPSTSWRSPQRSSPARMLRRHKAEWASFKDALGSASFVEEATHLLASLVAAEVELENLLGIHRQIGLPPERPIVGADVRRQAEQDALWLRQWLGIGQGPIQDIVSLLELEMGVRVYVRPLKRNHIRPLRLR